MILIFGGAYQGKQEYAQKTYGLTQADVYHCGDGQTEPELDHRAIAHLERFVLACARSGADAWAWFDAHLDALQDKILIFDDVSQGVVPMDPTERAWREMNGRCMTRLSQRADTVIRVFCGLGTKIK